MENLRTLKTLVADKHLGNKEVTRYHGKYHLLHICKNDVPVPEVISENATEIRDFIEARY